MEEKVKLQEYLEALRRKYEAYFDIYPDYSILGRRLDLYARSHVRSEKFFITKKVTLAAWETNEYCLVEGHSAKVSAPHVQKFTTFLVNAAGELVKPHKEHMSSVVTGILISEQGFDPEAIHIGTRFKHERSFRFGLHGWYSICLLLVDLSSGQVYANSKGKGVMKSYQPKSIPSKQSVLFPKY
ncbi:MAG: hypothetical protein ACE5KP_02805 [Dehalococcoidales bacterium]